MPQEPTRLSRASLALITGPRLGEPVWLLQWNRNWGAMNLVGGHREAEDPSDLVCIMRELHEELFGGLDGGQLARLNDALRGALDYDRTTSRWQDACMAAVRRSSPPNPPHEFPEYTAFSESTQTWTQYRLRIYVVALTEAGRRVLGRESTSTDPSEGGADAPNEWVTGSEIRRGLTASGRPVSPTVNRILGIPRDRG